MSNNENQYIHRFSRNVGILTSDDQNQLQSCRVAVAGVGGLGGQALINLARMGIGYFSIADMDTFDIPNTNRQIGASQKTMGRSKVDVMSEMVQDINPDAHVELYSSGIQADTVESFVKNSDIVVDSLDFFCLTARKQLYDACVKFKKTVVLSAPLGFSATLHVFTPNSMSPDQFFNWYEGISKFDRMIHFAVGIAPLALHGRYLKFSKEMLVERGTGPSISTACSLGGALVATEVLMALLNKRSLFHAPIYTQFDMRLGLYKRKKLYFGNRGIIQRLKIAFAKKYYGALEKQFLEFIK